MCSEGRGSRRWPVHALGAFPAPLKKVWGNCSTMRVVHPRSLYPLPSGPALGAVGASTRTTEYPSVLARGAGQGSDPEARAEQETGSFGRALVLGRVGSARPWQLLTKSDCCGPSL